MNIEHVAVWTNQLEGLKIFYVQYFQAQVGPKYFNPKSQFESYFLIFPSGGTRLELMHKLGLKTVLPAQESPVIGLAHFAFAVGSKDVVDALTARLEADGFCVVSHPRTTGDGYYESCVLDPDGNHVEITI